jgi:hypothetical protein
MILHILHLSDHLSKGFPIIFSPFIFIDPFLGVRKMMEDMEDMEDLCWKIMDSG